MEAKEGWLVRLDADAVLGRTSVLDPRFIFRAPSKGGLLSGETPPLIRFYEIPFLFLDNTWLLSMLNLCFIFDR